MFVKQGVLYYISSTKSIVFYKYIYLICLMINFSKLLPLIILLTLTGCQSVEMRGQFVSDQAISEINSEKPDKQEVANLLGTPTFVPDYTANTWYYVQRSMTSRAWFNPKVVQQRIVKVSFDSNGKLLEAVLLEGSHNEQISSLGDYTKTHGTEKSGIQKFVKNIGRFNKTTDGANRGKKKK